MVYPAPPFVVLWQYRFLPFPLSQIGQSDLLHVAASVGEFFVIRDFSQDTPPPCSTIFGFTSPLLCCFISSAISFHEAAGAPLGVAGQKIGKSYYLFSPVLYQHATFFSFSLLLSSLFQSLSLWRGLSPVSSWCCLLSQCFKAELKMLSLYRALYPDNFILRLSLDSNSAFLVHGSSWLVFSNILTAIWVIDAPLMFPGIALLCMTNIIRRDTMCPYRPPVLVLGLLLQQAC